MPEPIDTSKLGPIRFNYQRPSLDLMIAVCCAAKANGDPNHYMSGLSVAEAHALGNKLAEMREAMQEFVDRVDKGEVRSKRTYAKFKEILER